MGKWYENIFYQDITTKVTSVLTGLPTLIGIC